MSGDEEPVRGVAGLLRQLWLGLSAYRLFPGSPDRPGFVAAAERISAAARTALALGAVDVEVRSEGFVLGGELLPGDGSMDRLARACFERGVERLVVVAVPDGLDLDRTYAVLSMPQEDLREAGGAEEALREAGVTSIVLSPLGPAPVEGADHVPDDMTGIRATRIPDAETMTSQLMTGDLSGTPGDQAEVLLDRIRVLVSELSVEAGREIDLHSTVHDVVSELPAGLRRSLVEILVDRVREDPLAERLIGAMSNAELTRALVDLGRDGRRDPVELARQLAEAGVRHVDIVDLTSALEAGREEAGTILAGLEQLGIDLTEGGPESASGSVTDAIGAYLAATERDDVREVQATLPRTDEQRRGTAVLSLRDYLSLEEDADRLGEVLHLWAGELGQALRSRDPRRVRSLLDAAHEALGGPGEREREYLFDAYVREALQPDLLMEVVMASQADEAFSLQELLAPLGDRAVEVLLDLLAAEPDRHRRAVLLAALRQVARGHVGPVAARLRDPRWYVVRNAALLLGSAGETGVLDLLAPAARHETPQVRKEAVQALLAAGGIQAVPHLRGLAEGGAEDVRSMAVSALGAIRAPESAAALAAVAAASDSRGIRNMAFDQLAQGPDGVEVLRHLASTDARPRPPWSLRRRARRLVRRARGSAP